MASWQVILGLIGAILLPLAGGGIGVAGIPRESLAWWDSLRKAAWTAPTWLVGLGWFVTSIAMGVASFLVYQEGDGFNGRARWPLIVYMIVLILNFAWTPIFFNGQSLLWGWVEAAMLVVMLGVCAGLFWQLLPLAGGLMLAPFFWEFYSTSFLFYIWIHNREYQGV